MLTTEMVGKIFWFWMPTLDWQFSIKGFLGQEPEITIFRLIVWCALHFYLWAWTAPSSLIWHIVYPVTIYLSLGRSHTTHSLAPAHLTLFRIQLKFSISNFVCPTLLGLVASRHTETRSYGNQDLNKKYLKQHKCRFSLITDGTWLDKVQSKFCKTLKVSRWII